MMAFLCLEFPSDDWIILIQSFWFSVEIFSNFLNQIIGFSKICLQDWFICAQIFISLTFKFKKTFSARCWRPGLFMIFSILDLFFNEVWLISELIFNWGSFIQSYVFARSPLQYIPNRFSATSTTIPHNCWKFSKTMWLLDPLDTSFPWVKK